MIPSPEEDTFVQNIEVRGLEAQEIFLKHREKQRKAEEKKKRNEGWCDNEV